MAACFVACFCLVDGPDGVCGLIRIIRTDYVLASGPTVFAAEASPTMTAHPSGSGVLRTATLPAER